MLKLGAEVTLLSFTNAPVSRTVEAAPGVSRISFQARFTPHRHHRKAVRRELQITLMTAQTNYFQRETYQIILCNENYWQATDVSPAL